MADSGPAPLRTEVRLAEPVDLGLSLGVLRHGRRDPSVQLEGRTVWRATRTPHGPATQALVAERGAGAVRSWAWGPGAAWLAEHLIELVGGADDVAGFAALLAASPGRRPPAGWAVVATLARRQPGLRIPRTTAVMEACVPVVLAQKVTTLEATRSYRELLLTLGEPAPGPGCARGLRLPPAPSTLAATPSWVWHGVGVERRRADTIRRLAIAAAPLEETATLTRREARRRLRAVAGVGPWTAAEVALVAYGDPDAVSVGDFNLPDLVAWALAGRRHGDDALMLELLEPWRGHRGRVLRLLGAAGVGPPRRAPRQPLRSWRSW